MGIFKKVTGAVSSKANEALDAAIDPQKEMDMVILGLEEQEKKAIAELISYKATAKQMEHSLEEQKRLAEIWEKKAMLAVKAGQDDTAKECLQRRKQALIEAKNIARDQAEAAGYAAELNASRKKLQTKLKMLKLRKGTLATQIAAARSGGGGVFAESEALFDKLDEAEKQLDEELFAQEATRELEGGEGPDNFELEAELLAAGSSGVPHKGDALAELKAKMAEEKKLLKD